jgi:trimeric autotransporter adhesin
MKKFYPLFTLLLFIVSSHAFAQTNIVGGRMNEVFLKTDLSPSNGLNDPWEITYGPDDSLWITESKGYAVYKLHPNGGTKRKVLDISLKSTWLGTAAASDSVFNLQFVFSPTNPQGGLAGLAIHPDYNATIPKKYVYVSYIRSYLSTAGGSAGVFYQNRIARFTFNTVTGKLDSPVSLCDTLPGSSDHNSQRMIIAPVNGVDYLFYAQGDMGAGQFGNQNRTNNAQNISSYEGKILRFNLEPDGDAGTLDKWIPNTNPYNGAKQSAIWCMGIRNNQGFAYDSVRDILYGASHGPYSDDEINIIQPSKNYGHPLVIGFAADNNYNASSAGAYPTSGVPVIGSETANAASIGASYKDPIFTGYSPPQAQVNTIWTTNPGNGTWPSEAWSGMGLYNYSIIPDWKNSLVMAGLKWGRLIRTKLNAAGTAVVPTNGTDTVCYFDAPNRYRDIAFSPTGKDIFVIMDKSAATSGPSANNPGLISCAGCLQKYTFLGYNNVAGISAMPVVIPIAPGKPNICENANTVTINAANSNNNLWVPVTDTSGNVIAEINANNNNLGNVTTSMYVKTGAVREQPSTKTLYLNRNITITPQTQPSTAVSIRLYITNAEFTALQGATNSLSMPSGVSSISSLGIFKNSDVCGPAIASPAGAITMVNTATHTGGYVLQGTVNSFSTFYIANSAFLLDLHLLSFNGYIRNDIAQLKWETEDEKGTKTFTIERSINARDFDGVGTVPADGNTGTAIYTYSDTAINKLSSAIIYYRLKITDADGKYSYSGIVKLYMGNSKSTINIRPNPVVNDVTVDVVAVEAEKASWELTDITGKTVLQHSVILIKGENEFNIMLGKLPAGVYYLKVLGNTINQGIKLQKL